VDQVEFASHERFRQLRPAPHQGGPFGSQPFLGKEAFGVGDEQGRGIGDGDVADFDRRSDVFLRAAGGQCLAQQTRAGQGRRAPSGQS